MSKEKSKVNRPVVWPQPGTLFSIKELHTLNPEFPEITLRVRVTNAIEKDKTVSFVGHKNKQKGRPTMILTVGSVTTDVINKAIADGVQVADSTKALVNVINVKTPISTEDNPPAVSVAASPISVGLVSASS